MRRALLLALVVAGLLAAVLLLGFSVSRYNVKGQRVDDSLADFLFMMAGYSALTFDPQPAALDEQRIAFALRRYRGTTHNEVKEVAARYIARWKLAAIPQLAQASRQADGPLLEGVARALEAIGGAEILPVLLDILQRHRFFERDRPQDLRGQPLILRHHLVQALSATRTREAAELLIDIHRRVKRVNPMWAPLILSDIALTGHGAPFLLDAARQSANAKELDNYIWPLARTRDPEAIEFLVGLFSRSELAIRRSVRDALDQTAGPAAVPAVLDVLKRTRDEQLMGWITNSILDDEDARHHPEVVAVLEPLLTHPALAWEARYALIRIGTKDAYAAIARQFNRLDPSQLIRELEYANVHALPLIERYLGSSDPQLRRMMLYKLPEMFVPEAAPLITPRLADGDASVRKAAREAALTMDRVLFWKGLTELLPERVGPSLFYAFRPTFFGAPLDHMLPLLRIVHGVGVALSALLALALLFGMVKVIEPYRFDLFAAFLLLEGLVGDFLLLEFGRHPWLLIQVATGCHLALLAGVLLQPREHLPGQLGGRFERLMGASLWLLTPLLLVFTTPVLAAALRYAFHGAAWSLTLLALSALVTVLVVEQWALRWSLLPRRAASERWLAALIWIALTLLLLIAILVWSDHLWASARREEAVFTLIVAVPLLWLPLGKLPGLLIDPGEPAPLPPVPGERFAAADLGGLIALRPCAVSWLGALLKAGIVLATAVAAAVMAGWKGKALSMLLAIIMAPVGAAVATLMVTLLVPAWTIHVRGGFIRVAASRAGMTFWHTGWRRRLVLPLALQRALGAKPESDDPERRSALRPEEYAWIKTVVEQSARASQSGGERS